MNKSVLSNDLSLSPSELYVNDLKKMLDFYQNYVGLDLLDKTSKQAILGHNKTPILKLSSKPKLKSATFPSAGLFHNAIVFSSRSKLSSTVRDLLLKKPELYVGTGDHVVSEAFYFNDPEGNGLELYFDRPRDQWQWVNGRVVMGTYYIDPENYISQYVSGDENQSKEKHLGHVHLRVGDIPNARKFYADTLGFDVTFDMPSAIFLSVGGYHHHIGANTWMSQGAGVKSPALGLGEFDIKLESKDDLADLIQRLKNKNYEFKESSDKVLIADPWGNQIGLSA